MVKLEKIRHTTTVAHQQTQPEIQADFEEGGFASANELHMSLALQINAAMETSAGYGKKSLQWFLYLREDQYHDFIIQTSNGKLFEGVLLNSEDIAYLLKPVLEGRDWTDYVNSFAHDYTGASMLAQRYGSNYIGIKRQHPLPHINKVWGLQSLSYAMENNQSRKIQEVLAPKTNNKPGSFLITKFNNLFKKTDEVTLKRISSIALAYLLGETHEHDVNVNLNAVINILSSMLSQPPTLESLHIDSAFIVGKETFNLQVRMRAIEALYRLAKKHPISQETLLSSVLSYLYSVEEKANFYFGTCKPQKNIPIETLRVFNVRNLASKSGAHEEKNVVEKGDLLTTGEVEYLYEYAIQKNAECCLRALFYAATVNGQMLPETSGEITRQQITLHCQSLLQPSAKMVSEEQKLAAACFLVIYPETEERFKMGMNDILSRLPSVDSANTQGGVISLLYVPRIQLTTATH